MNEEKFQKVVEKVSKSFDEIGLYINNISFGMLPKDADEESISKFMDLEEGDIEKEFEEGRAEAFMAVQLHVGDVAWSERVQNPDLFNEKKEFEEIIPTDSELNIMMLRDEISDDKFWDDFD